MTHLEFQHQIVETLLKSSDQTRQIIFTLSVISQNKENSSSTCQWEHMSKLLYCVLCKVQLAESRKRRALSEFSPNYIKRRRGPQTI
jgi:hypothetical protein